MEPIQWSRWMSVGNDALDEDHRVLIGIVNKLYDETNREDPVVIDLILDELIAYTRDHFAKEEAQMQRLNYPTFAAHKQLHDSLTRQVEDYRRTVRANRQRISGEEVFLFCSDWLGKHILKEDIRFGEYADGEAELATTG
ncbi:bacteriohemerythrin [Azospirillum picis]|uniref:Hemerythrin n=1 Tax=Azospirillum picis TaxID=488438 RepID=A0ABU0MJ26_9PROT|nr:bacteriohemerythrin [Azospirillum picis]MBP2299499.1 hemerythrin [Azospirillum picis]MDQ0533374.1 hemerythrin [Azospirillum picis]